MKPRHKFLNSFIALMVAVSFIPVTGQFAFAEGETPGAESSAPAAETPQDVETPQDEGTATDKATTETTAPQPAAAPAPAFNVNGQVKGLKIGGRTYKSVKISWNAYANAAGYELYRADKKKGKYKKIKTLSACSFNDKGNKTLGKTKFYRVRAYVTVGGKKLYSKFSSTLGAAPKLSNPKTATTTGVTAGVKIKWSGVSDAKYYQVYRATSKSGKYKRIKTTKSKSYTDKAVSAGTRYYYKVRAYRTVKKKKRYGAFSPKAEGMALLGNVGNLNVTINNKNGVVTASWAAKKGAAGYELQRALSGGKYTTIATTSERSRTDKLTASGSYVYRVRAYSIVNGKTQYGAYSAPGGRGNALAQAQSWVGCKESNGSHKKIIDIYNGYNPASGKIGYRTPWCAAFVSAVAIKTGNTAVIPVHSYCPSMLNLFAEKTYNKKYTPNGGDVIFFDWNHNKVPDHVGMVEKTSGDNVTTIEGNYSDAVKRRTFKKGYSLLLAYGLPNYTVRNTVAYTAPADQVSVADAGMVKVACVEIENALETETPEAETPEAAAAETGTDAFAAEPAENIAEEAGAPATSETAEEPSEAPAATEAADEPSEAPKTAEAAEEPSEKAAEPTDVETAETIVEYIQEEAPAEEADVPAAEESTFNAFLAYEICDEMDIDACVVTVTDADGTERSYNEVVLDGELYILDATEEGGALEKFIPEEIN